MIDQSISKVLKRDNRVFIPEFGAFYLSETNNKIEFNDLLNFDDGRILTEIAKSLSISQEEAAEKLDAHVSNIKHAVESGEGYFFEEIGFLKRDETGNYEFSDSETEVSTDNTGQTEKPYLADSEDFAKYDFQDIEDEPEQTVNSHAQENEMDFSVDLSGDEMKSEIQHESNQDMLVEGDYTDDLQVEENNEYLVDQNENVEEYYKRKEEYFSKGKKKISLLKILFASFIFILLSASVVYYFNQDLIDDRLEQLGLTKLFEEMNISKATFSPITSADESGEAINAIDKTEEKDPVEKDVDSKAVEDTQLVSEVEEKSNESSVKAGNFYSIIIGSFKNESNADRLVAKVINGGVQVEKFMGKNGLFFVGIEKIQGKKVALQKLEKIRIEEPSAWFKKLE